MKTASYRGAKESESELPRLHTPHEANSRSDAFVSAAHPLPQLCPLCREHADVAMVPSHLTLDHVDLRAPAVAMIRSLNSGWAEEDGLCSRCWEFYVGLGRVLNWLDHADSNPNDGDRRINTKV